MNKHLLYTGSIIKLVTETNVMEILLLNMIVTDYPCFINNALNLHLVLRTTKTILKRLYLIAYNFLKFSNNLDLIILTNINFTNF